MRANDIPYKEMKVINVPPQSRLTEDVAKYFDDMMSVASPQDYRDTLAEIYHVYVLHEHRSLPPHFYDMARRMITMMGFFKTCEGK